MRSFREMDILTVTVFSDAGYGSEENYEYLDHAKTIENRIIDVSHRLNELKAKARDRLLSEKCLVHRSQRPIDVERVFGIIKHNRASDDFGLKE